jgi:hypothetical protein
MSDREDTATRVHLLAVPRSVTVHAERRADAFGAGHHYAVTGHSKIGEELFVEMIVSAGDAEDAPTALRVALGRMRERGW